MCGDQRLHQWPRQRLHRPGRSQPPPGQSGGSRGHDRTADRIRDNLAAGIRGSTADSRLGESVRHSLLASRADTASSEDSQRLLPELWTCTHRWIGTGGTICQDMRTTAHRMYRSKRDTGPSRLVLTAVAMGHLVAPYVMEDGPQVPRVARAWVGL